uniref:Zgc:65997 n=1 Tax=Latimeria chalumnae TaxID=7897 RepID=H3AHF4_LATCH
KMAVALLQGSSRGLGLQFCKYILSKHRKAMVIATCRAPDTGNQLRKLKGDYPNRVTILKLDVTREDEIKDVADAVKEQFGKLDLLINSSAMLHPSGKGETSLRDVSAEGFAKTLATNAVGPLVMAKYFAPLLLKGSGMFGHQHSAVLVNMTAKVGSISDNALGGWYSYRLSKAALNMATKNLSIELGHGRKKVVCISLHPGTVDTDLSRPHHKNVPKDKLFTPEYSVQCLMSIVENISMDKTGSFFAWDGSELPW